MSTLAASWAVRVPATLFAGLPGVGWSVETPSRRTSTTSVISTPSFRRRSSIRSEDFDFASGSNYNGNHNAELLAGTAAYVEARQYLQPAVDFFERAIVAATGQGILSADLLACVSFPVKNAFSKFSNLRRSSLSFIPSSFLNADRFCTVGGRSIPLPRQHFESPLQRTILPSCRTVAAAGAWDGCQCAVD